jgi:hypothetical protein
VADPALGAALGGLPGSATPPDTQTAVPGGTVRRLLSLPGFLDPTVPRECAFVRGMELAARDLWHGSVRVALAFPHPVHSYAARLGEVDSTEAVR